MGMLQEAAKQQRVLRRFSRIVADARHLPLSAGSIDLVFSNLMLQWCNEPDQVFAEAGRVLRPNGLFIFTTLGPDTLKELRLALQTVGRKLSMFLNQRKRVQQEGERRDIFLRYLGEVAGAVSAIKGYNDRSKKQLYHQLVDNLFRESFIGPSVKRSGFLEFVYRLRSLANRREPFSKSFFPLRANSFSVINGPKHVSTTSSWRAVPRLAVAS